MFDGRGKPPIDQDTADWIEDIFGWLLEHQGGYARFRQTPLVLANETFFPFNDLTGLGLGEAVFERAKHFAGMESWMCRLEARAPDPVVDREDVSPELQPPIEGSFQLGEEPGSVPLISYNTELLQDPPALIAVLARELASYLVATIPDAPPGGWGRIDAAADVAAIFLGFGVIIVNTRVRRGRSSLAEQGAPHLNKDALTFALGLFVALRGEGRKPVMLQLSSDQQGAFKRSLQFFERNELITTRLRQTEIRTSRATQF